MGRGGKGKQTKRYQSAFAARENRRDKLRTLTSKYWHVFIPVRSKQIVQHMNTSAFRQTRERKSSHCSGGHMWRRNRSHMLTLLSSLHVTQH